MNHAGLASLLLGGVLLTGMGATAATPPPAAATDAQPAEPAATATNPAPTIQATAAGPFNETMQAAIGAPEPGKAQVVFFRAKKFTGAAAKFIVREGDTEYGRLVSGVYFVRNLEPGRHVFTVHTENKDVTTVELEAGETYFLEGSTSMGAFVGHANLGPSDATTFEAALRKMKKV